MFCLALYCTNTAAAAQELPDPVAELASRIQLKYPNLGAIKNQFGDQAIWEKTTSPNLHVPGEMDIIRKMESPGIEIGTLEVPHIDRFFTISVAVNNNYLEDFLGIDIGSSREDVIKTFGNRYETEGNNLIYYDLEAGYNVVVFVIENGTVIEMIYLLYVD
jgi:hypothetical protein